MKTPTFPSVPLLSFFLFLALPPTLMPSSSRFAWASEVALFPSSGCYSHDQMMYEVGLEFPHENVSWIQIYLYEFGFGTAKIPQHWRRLLVNRTTPEANAFNEAGSRLIWETMVPFDENRPWDLRGLLAFMDILQRSKRECARLFRNGDFARFAAQRKVELVVVDHFLQECITVMASTLNATTVQFSNWPIADGYVSPLNLPATPSAFSKTGSAFPGRSMTFGQRVANTLFDVAIQTARNLQSHSIAAIFGEAGNAHVNLFDVEAKHLIYAGRSEFLAEPVRPLNNRLKHFGCGSCRDPEEYEIRAPMDLSPTFSNTEKNAHLRPRTNFSTTELRSSAFNGTVVIACHQTNNTMMSTSFSTSKLAHAQNRTSSRTAETRFLDAQRQFPDIDFLELETHRFVLVSFGSVAKVAYMQSALLERFLHAFAHVDALVLWATNGPPAAFLGPDAKVPGNVRLVPWAPIKLLLAHRNLQWFVCHGGVNTLNELLNFGVAVFGVPLQGDQPSNLNRVRELGLGRSLDVAGIWAGRLPFELQQMQLRLAQYRTRARLVSSMVRSHRALGPRLQHFWLHWAKRHGTRLRGSGVGQRLFHFSYRPAHEHWAAAELGSAVLVLTGLVALLSL